jgi:hypothetical protein
MTERVRLEELAFARSGDKGDVVNVGLMAKSRRIYEHLAQLITKESIAAHLGEWVQGEIEIHPMPNIDSLQIVLRRALGGGAPKTLRFDQTGKAMATALLRFELEVEPILRQDARETMERLA